MKLPSSAPSLDRRRFLALSGALASATALRAATGTQNSGTASSIVDVLSRIRQPTFPAQDFRITDFGARSGPGEDALPALRQAVRACNAAGGGRVIVPKGVWLLGGPLPLQSHVNLHLEDGAHLRFLTDDPDRFLPLVLTRWEGTELFNYSPFIYAYQAVNVAITGSGTVDGNSANTFVKWRSRQGEAQQALRRMGAEGAPLATRVFGRGHWLRPPLVQFFGCSQVLVDGPRFIDAPFWVLHAIGCNSVTVRRVTVDSPHLNNDGFDPESCSDVLVEDCVFRTGDDCIALKSGRDQDGWRLGRPTENVLIRRCELHAPTAGSGLALGSEMSGGVRTVFVESLRIGTAKTALNFKSNLDRGGYAENVIVRDVSVDQTDSLLLVTTGYHGYRGGRFPPTFRRFHFENIRCKKAAAPISAQGVPDATLQDFTVRDLSVEQTSKPAIVRHVRNFRSERIVIEGKSIEFDRDID